MNHAVVDVCLQAALTAIATHGEMGAGELLSAIDHSSHVTIIVLGPDFDADQITKVMADAWQAQTPQGSC